MAKNKKKLLFSILLILIVIITINTSYAGSFSDLQSSINGATGTLNLTDNYTDTQGGSQIITINKDITIDGNGNTINFNRQSTHTTENRIEISSGYTVILKNIILINAYNNNDEYPAGAIWNNGILILNNTTFKNNKGNGGAGAIGNAGTLTVYDSNFINNTASSSASAGAIWNYGENVLIINNSTFTNNTADGDGGAIISKKSVTITNSTFTNNNAYKGGAIMMSNEGILEIHNSIFINNTASHGGAIYTTNPSNKIINSTFTYNNASTSGGAIHNGDDTHSSNLNITRSTFTNNTVTGTGGSGGAVFDANGVLNISQSIIIGTGYQITKGTGGTIPTVIAEDNYWGNNNPSVNVNETYVFKLNATNEAIIGEEVDLNIIYVLNNSNNIIWIGPEIDIGTVTFTSTPSGTIDKKNNTHATFTPSTIDTYTITATSTNIPILSTEITTRVMNFYDLQQEINNITTGTELNLTNDYFDNNGTQITITSPIIINGNGHILNFNKQNANNIIINNGATATLKI